MVWRRALICSGRVVSGVRLSRTTAACCPNTAGSGVGRVEPRESRRGQPVSRGLPLGTRSLQPVAERHQFIDLGNDAVLLGEGWEGTG